MSTNGLSTVADRLATLAQRVRERAVQGGTFDGEVAADVEELASLAALLAEVHDGLATLQLPPLEAMGHVRALGSC